MTSSRRSLGRPLLLVGLLAALGLVVLVPGRKASRPPEVSSSVDAEIVVPANDGSVDASSPPAEPDATPDAEVDAAAVDAGPYEEPDADLSIDTWSSDTACAADVQKTIAALSAFVHAERTRVAAISVPGSPPHVGVARVDVSVETMKEHLPKHLCHATPGGTWSLVFEDFRGDLASDLRPARLAQEIQFPSDDNPKINRYEGLEVTANGHLYFRPAGADAGVALASLLRWSVTSALDGATVSFSGVDELQSGDVDGDGRDEALVLSSTGEDWRIEGLGPRVHHATVYSAPHQQIGLLPGLPPVTITEMTDADHDGRMDFLSSDPFVGEDEGPVGNVPLEGPPLLIHSLPSGGFSRDDAEAQMYARALCPSPPTRLTSRNAKEASSYAGIPLYLTEWGNEAIRATVCSRLWDVPAATLRSWVTHATGGAELTRWTSLPPPLVLHDLHDR